MHSRQTTSRVLSLLLITVLVSLGSGCASKFASAPLADGKLTDSLVNMYDKVSLSDLYKQGNRGKAERNIVINELMTLSEHNYQKFRNEFYAGNAETQFIFDFIALGLSTAGGLTTGGAAPILSGVSAAVQGTQGKFNTRFFLDKTTEALVNGMDTLRAEKKEIILAKMAKLDISEYSTEEGIRDVLEYHAGGSLISALVKLAADSGQKKEAAERQLKNTEMDLAGIHDTTFSEDQSTQILNQFVTPDGTTVDPINQTQLSKWMDANGLKEVPIAMFINGGPAFSAKRQQALRDLKLSN